MTANTSAIARLRSLCDAATPGNWGKASYSETKSKLTWIRSENGEQVCAWVNMTDATFIVTARQVVPALLDIVELQRKVIYGHVHFYSTDDLKKRQEHEDNEQALEAAYAALEEVV